LGIARGSGIAGDPRIMTTPCSFRDDPALPDFDDAASVAVMGAECAIFS